MPQESEVMNGNVADHLILPVVTEPRTDPRRRAAERIIMQHMALNAGVGLLPVGLPVELAAGAAVDAVMIARIARLYGHDFDRVQGAALVAVVGANLAATAASDLLLNVAGSLAPSWMRPLQILAMPVALASFAYAIGILFTEHFEAGGGMKNIDIAAWREKLDAHMSEGKALARRVLRPRREEAA